MDELDHDTQLNSGEFPSETRIGKHYLNEGRHMRVESGTCNVCSAPCSSCMHFSRDIPAMESKIESGFSENTRKEADHFSFINSDTSPLYKSRVCESRQLTASETSNTISDSCSHDSISENTESKFTMRTGTYDASDDVDMPPKSSSCETVREDKHQGKGHIITDQTVMSSRCRPAPVMLQQSFSSQEEEQRVLECHDDNISCVTGVRDGNIAVGDLETVFDRKYLSSSSVSNSDLLAKGQKKVVGVSNSNSIVEERQSYSKKPTPCTKEFLQKKTSSSSSENAECFQKTNPLECVRSNDDPSPKVQSSYSHCHGRNFLFHSVDLKDLDGNSSSQLQREPSECSMEHVESSLIGSLSTGLVEEHKCTAPNPAESPPSIKDLKVSQIGSDFSSEAAGNSHHCLAPVSGMGDGKPPNETIKCDPLNVQFGKSSSLSEASDILVNHAIKESTNSDPDIEEDDVKVCDICGDAGREDLLAVCSKCSDGAEHTYCMRIMLDKVPDGYWLCEECKFKEDAENQYLDKSETISGASIGPCLNEKSQNFEGSDNHKLIAQMDTNLIDAEATQVSRGLLDMKLIDSEATKFSKGIQGSHSTTKRHSDNGDVTSTLNRKAPETSVVGAGATSPSKKTPLSRESSFKNSDVGKVNPSNVAPPFGSLSANNSQVIARTATSCINSSRVQSLMSPRGRLSKSISFNHFNMRPKVKHVNENIILKTNLTRDLVSNDPKKDGFRRTVSRSASFKCPSSVRSNIMDSPTKTQPHNISVAEDTKNMKQYKERNLMEKKCSVKLDRPLNSSAVALREEKPYKLSDSRMTNANKGSEGAHDIVGPNEVKRQLSNSSRIPSSIGVCNSEDQKQNQVISMEGTHNSYRAADELCQPYNALQHGLPQPSQSTNSDEKSKETTSFSNSLSAVPMGSKILQCQKCNETGHTKQFCPIDKLRLSALKPSAKPRDATYKNNKWKDAVEVAISRNRRGKNNILSDQSEKHALSRTDIGSESASKIQLSSTSSCVKNMPSLGGPSTKLDKLKDSPVDSSKTATVDVKERTSIETVGASTDSDIDALGRPKVKTLGQVLPDGASVLSNPLGVSAIPKHDYIWQGGFQVRRPEVITEIFDGVQAHLSTLASPKVLEVVTKFPSKVLLDEVPRLSSWPLQFQENCPTEENIALFFFAKDIESFEKNYKKLLENLLKYDLALKGYIDGTELLIFPSNMLPVKSQRWNRFLFLWGVFRGKSLIFSEPLSDAQKKLCRSRANAECSAKELSTPVMTEASLTQKASTSEKTSTFEHNTGLYGCVRSVETAPSRSTAYTNEHSLVQNSSCQADADNKLPLRMQASCSFPESSLSISIKQEIGSLDTSSESQVKSSDAQQFSQVKGVGTCLKGSSGNVGIIKDTNSPPHFQNVGVRNSFKITPFSTNFQSCRQADFPSNSRPRLSSDPSNICQPSSSLCFQGSDAEGCNDEVKKKGNDRRMEVATTSVSDANISMTQERVLSWELKPNKKRAHSHSPEPVSRAYCETSVSDSKGILWKYDYDCLSLEERNETKRIKISDEVDPCFSGREDRLPPKVHPMLAGFLNEQLKDSVCNETTMPENSRTTERYFFPVELGSLRDANSGKITPLEIISSDDEDYHQSSIPNLELALGAETKRSTKQEMLPLLSPLAAKKSDIGKLPDPVVLDGDDASASLSLSLAFPFSERERTGNKNTRPHVNTSLLLFSPYPDT